MRKLKLVVVVVVVHNFRFSPTYCRAMQASKRLSFHLLGPSSVLLVMPIALMTVIVVVTTIFALE